MIIIMDIANNISVFNIHIFAHINSAILLEIAASNA